MSYAFAAPAVGCRGVMFSTCLSVYACGGIVRLAWRRLPVSEFMNQYMSNFIHRQVIENNKRKAIYNKHRNIIDMLDYRAVTDVGLCVAYKINRK